MSLADVAIKRPVFATILNAVLIVFGLFGYSRIGIDQFPEVDFPTVVITVPYPGADPASVEQKILEPLERGLAGLQQLESMTSNALPNMGQIILQFKLERDGDKAAQDVRDKMATLLGSLPEEAEQPIIQKFDLSGQPIVIMSLTSDDVSFAELSRLADDVVRPAMEQIDGVGNVRLIGNREREIHVNLQRPKLQSFGIGPSQVEQAISMQISEIPSGRIESREHLLRLRAEGTLSSAEEIAMLPIALPTGATIRVSDVARVDDTLAREESFAAHNGKSTILLSIFKQTGGNTVAVAEGVHEKLEELKIRLPASVKVNVVKDNAIYIKGLIDAVEFDLVLGALLAIFIVLIFLFDWRATVISAVAIPTSVIGTLAFIQYLGFTLNVMTTLALTLSIGILVDDAIVVVENIYRHLSMGKKPIQAAQDGTNEIGLAVFAITLSIVSVFVPVAFMEGIIGRFFFQFGITVAVAVILSLFVAFTLTPMMSSRLLKGGASHGHHVPAVFARVDRGLRWVEHAYRSLLSLVLKHRGLTVALGIVILIVSGIMLQFVPKAFFPQEDRGELNIVYEMEEGTAIQTAKEKAMQLTSFLQAYPGVQQVVMFIGSGAEQKPNLATFEVTLVDKSQRDFSQQEAILRLRDEMAKRKGPKERFEVNQQTGGGGRAQPIQIILQGNDYEQLRVFANEMKDWVASNVEGAVDVSTSEPPLSDEIKVVTNPLLAADLGLSTTQIGMTLRSLFEGIKIGEILDKGLRYDVRLQVDEAFRQNPSDLSGLSLTNAQGARVDLASVAEVDVTKAPSKIERRGGQKQIMLLSNFNGKDEGGALTMIKDEIRQRAPEGITFGFDGTSKFLQEAIAAIISAMILAILLVYMVLCAQFESYLTPFVIMMSVPLAFSGAFLGLLVTQKSLSIYSMIGLIMLVGLVTKNAILLIDFTLQRMREGLSVHDALMEAGPIRLRPILMTTAAMIFGMLPIAIGHGVGGEARSPMAVCVIGGLISSTLLTLVVIPCIFSLMQGFMQWFKTKRAMIGHGRAKRSQGIV